MRHRLLDQGLQPQSCQEISPNNLIPDDPPGCLLGLRPNTLPASAEASCAGASGAHLRKQGAEGATYLATPPLKCQDSSQHTLTQVHQRHFIGLNPALENTSSPACGPHSSAWESRASSTVPPNSRIDNKQTPIKPSSRGPHPSTCESRMSSAVMPCPPTHDDKMLTQSPSRGNSTGCEATPSAPPLPGLYLPPEERTPLATGLYLPPEQRTPPTTGLYPPSEQRASMGSSRFIGRHVHPVPRPLHDPTPTATGGAMSNLSGASPVGMGIGAFSGENQVPDFIPRYQPMYGPPNFQQESAPSPHPFPSLGGSPFFQALPQWGAGGPFRVPVPPPEHAREHALLRTGFGFGVQAPLAVFWDIENCSLPAGVPADIVASCVRRSLAACPDTTLYHVKVFSAYGDFNLLPRRIREGCQRTGITLIDVPNGRKDAADKAIMADMFLFAMDHPPPSALFLISGDVDFSPSLHKLCLRGYSVFVAVPNFVGVSRSLTSSASAAWDWGSLARGYGLVPAELAPPHVPAPRIARRHGAAFHRPGAQPPMPGVRGDSTATVLHQIGLGGVDSGTSGTDAVLGAGTSSDSTVDESPERVQPLRNSEQETPSDTSMLPNGDSVKSSVAQIAEEGDPTVGSWEPTLRSMLAGKGPERSNSPTQNRDGELPVGVADSKRSLQDSSPPPVGNGDIASAEGTEWGPCTLPVRNGDVAAAAGHFRHLLTANGGRLQLGQVPTEYHRTFGVPLVLSDFGVSKIVQLVARMKGQVEVVLSGKKKFLVLPKAGGQGQVEVVLSGRKKSVVLPKAGGQGQVEVALSAKKKLLVLPKAGGQEHVASTSARAVQERSVRKCAKEGSTGNICSGPDEAAKEQDTEGVSPAGTVLKGSLWVRRPEESVEEGSPEELEEVISSGSLQTIGEAAGAAEVDLLSVRLQGTSAEKLEQTGAVEKEGLAESGPGGLNAIVPVAPTPDMDPEQTGAVEEEGLNESGPGGLKKSGPIGDTEIEEMLQALEMKRRLLRSDLPAVLPQPAASDKGRHMLLQPAVNDTEEQEEQVTLRPAASSKETHTEAQVTLQPAANDIERYAFFQPSASDTSGLVTVLPAGRETRPTAPAERAVEAASFWAGLRAAAGTRPQAVALGRIRPIRVEEGAAEGVEDEEEEEEGAEQGEEEEEEIVWMAPGVFQRESSPAATVHQKVLRSAETVLQKAPSTAATVQPIEPSIESAERPKKASPAPTVQPKVSSTVTTVLQKESMPAAKGMSKASSAGATVQLKESSPMAAVQHNESGVAAAVQLKQSSAAAAVAQQQNCRPCEDVTGGEETGGETDPGDEMILWPGSCASHRDTAEARDVNREVAADIFVEHTSSKTIKDIALLCWANATTAFDTPDANGGVTSIPSPELVAGMADSASRRQEGPGARVAAQEGRTGSRKEGVQENCKSLEEMGSTGPSETLEGIAGASVVAVHAGRGGFVGATEGCENALPQKEVHNAVTEGGVTSQENVTGESSALSLWTRVTGLSETTVPGPELPGHDEGEASRAGVGQGMSSELLLSCRDNEVSPHATAGQLQGSRKGVRTRRARRVDGPEEQWGVTQERREMDGSLVGEGVMAKNVPALMEGPALSTHQGQVVSGCDGHASRLGGDASGRDYGASGRHDGDSGPCDGTSGGVDGVPERVGASVSDDGATGRDDGVPEKVKGVSVCDRDASGSGGSAPEKGEGLLGCDEGASGSSEGSSARDQGELASSVRLPSVEHSCRGASVQGAAPRNREDHKNLNCPAPANDKQSRVDLEEERRLGKGEVGECKDLMSSWDLSWWARLL